MVPLAGRGQGGDRELAAWSYTNPTILVAVIGDIGLLASGVMDAFLSGMFQRHLEAQMIEGALVLKSGDQDQAGEKPENVPRPRG
jgi:hypothetical protein